MATRTATRRFDVGTTGWTVDDLYDPRIERKWFQGRYELVEGVLTKMPPAYIDGGVPTDRLVDMLKAHFRQVGLEGDFAWEADLVISPKRVVRVDAVFLTRPELEQQRAAEARFGKARKAVKYGRIWVPPTLLIESVSLGHEAHDRDTKGAWYAQFGAPSYWILDAYSRTLECLNLRSGTYETDQVGHDADQVRPSAFPGLAIPLADLWL